MHARPHALWLIAAAAAALLAACEGSGGGAADGSGGRDGAGAADVARDAAAGADQAGAGDAAADAAPPADSGGLPPGDAPGGADLTTADVPQGTGAFGDPCGSGVECQTGLCWANTLTQGCTAPCAADADCAEWGAQCRRLAEGPGGAVLEGCGPPAMTGNPTCDDHDDCVYPYTCRTDEGWCVLPECRYDADCPAEEHCNVRSRQCEVDACLNAIQCTSPLDFCVDGRCGPAECSTRADCPAGEACFVKTGVCAVVPPCNDEGACDFYNQQCVDGLCELLLCLPEDPCADAAATCDPATGRCERPCTGAGDCPAGQTCDTGRGRCYENRQPYAMAGVRMGGAVKPAADVSPFTTVTLDGSASVDPDGTTLDYRWRLDDAPPGATLTVGAPLPGAVGPTPTWEPPGAGRWAVGLVVVDAGGRASFPVVVIVNVGP